MEEPPSAPPSSRKSNGKSALWSTRKGLVIFTLVMVVLAGYGFSVRFVEFFRTLQADKTGNFTIVPMLNYLTVAAGFLCLFGWAAFRGMFRDIERPKYTMLENEEKLDRRGKAIP